ncbi:MerR family transcriptional regulator [Phytoactinopolyspora halotolerans]|uniref:MerR family transcriptional regulator n=1 Tax=Phytoactinopolyspora halotolerans TaxID=1981512 RepID=A0A6L9SA76_9ACTN|nr:MerR family transcriptional regulator [Phytoactinopolyspora halotolerans]NEE01953.1 MerR family transcriptional regulator [Phytoactinopolyspora halotolerans]
MRIGALARKTGVNQRLLRYYEEQGLLHPARDANGYRMYTDADVVSVRHIRHLLAAGLPTAVIGELLECVHDDGERPTPSLCPAMLKQLTRQYARASEEIERLQQSKEIIASLLNAQPTNADR